MDPTTAATGMSAAAQMSIVDLIHQGWYATYPLILSSVIMVSIVIERMWTLGRIGAGIDDLTDRVCEALAKSDLPQATSLIESRRAKSPASRIYASLLPLIRKGNVEEILEFGERRRLDENRLLKRGIWVLGTIGASAPFVGLFGTVVGIINAFRGMKNAETAGIGAVAGGISEALFVTALGLLVAVPAVWLFNYFTGKVDGFIVEMDNSASELVDYFIKNRTKQLKT